MKFYNLKEYNMSGQILTSETSQMNSSVEYWRKVIKKDEKEGCYVQAVFEYDKTIKEIVLTRYFLISRKDNKRITINLVKNPEKLKKLRKR